MRKKGRRQTLQKGAKKFFSYDFFGKNPKDKANPCVFGVKNCPILPCCFHSFYHEKWSFWPGGGPPPENRVFDQNSTFFDRKSGKSGVLGSGRPGTPDFHVFGHKIGLFWFFDQKTPELRNFYRFFGFFSFFFDISDSKTIVFDNFSEKTYKNR